MIAAHEERIILGPCRCQGCGGEVAYSMLGAVHLGWVHEDGRFTCPRQRVLPAGLTHREYQREWMRQKRAASAYQEAVG